MSTWIKTVFNSFGKPADVLQLEHVSGIPVPADDEIVYKLTYSPIHPSNLYYIAGTYGETRPTLPQTPGSEFVANVVAVGKNVPADKAQVGHRYFVIGPSGAWAEYIVKNYKTNFAMELPKEIPDEQAAQVVVNGLSAYAMLFIESNPQPGDWFIQSASGSAVGRIVAQLAKLKGLNLINIVRREEQAKELQAGGEIAFAFDGSNKAAVLEKVKQATGGKGVKYALEAVGGATGELLLDSLSFGGLLLIYGVLQGEPIPLDCGKTLFRQLTVKGFWLQVYIGREEFTKALADYVGMLTRKEITVPIGDVFSLKDVKAAIAESTRSGKPGKVLLKP